jgi:hypothetical protein
VTATFGDSGATLCQKRFLYSTPYQKQGFYVTNYISLRPNVSQQDDIVVSLVFDIGAKDK